MTTALSAANDSMEDTVKSFCARLCSGTCGILVTRKGQTITGVKGDPDCQFNRGHICPKGRALPEFLYHPDRLKFPLKRIGEKGEDKWQPISMDEALDTIASKLEKSVAEFGPESIMFYAGAYRGLEFKSADRQHRTPRSGYGQCQFARAYV